MENEGTAAKKEPHVYAFDQFIQGSLAYSPAYTLEALQQIWPKLRAIRSVEDDMAYQKAGVDLLLYDQELPTNDEDIARIAPDRSVDKKERGVNKITNRVYDDIALEIFSLSAKNLEGENLKAAIKLVGPELLALLRKGASVDEAFVEISKKFAEYRIRRGWATAEKESRTVTGVAYAITPRGVGYWLDTEALRQTFARKDFFGGTTFIGATPSQQMVGSGPFWGVGNIAVTPKHLEKYMPVPAYKFPEKVRDFNVSAGSVLPASARVPQGAALVDTICPDF